MIEARCSYQRKQTTISVQQIATYFASGGQTIIHPEPRRCFEVPIQGALPEELNFIA